MCVLSCVCMYVFVCVYQYLYDGYLCVYYVFVFIVILIKGTGKLFDIGSRKCQAKLEGHEGDVSKVILQYKILGMLQY